MSDRHRVLVVEDDKATAHDLCDIIRPLNCEPIVFDNAQEAQAALEREVICCAVLDLEIKSTPDSIKGNVPAGLGLVRDVRQRYRSHPGLCFTMPIIVVSGHASEADEAVQVMRYGANDVIQKPLDVMEVTERLRQALAQSGRATHADCLRSADPATPSGLVISINGT